MSKPQPVALRLAEQYDHGDPATHGNAWKAAVCSELLLQQAHITELESQLAQRFDAADMATASAQGFRDGVASLTAQAADSVQEDANCAWSNDELTAIYNEANGITVKNPPITTERIFAAMRRVAQIAARAAQKEKP